MWGISCLRNRATQAIHRSPLHPLSQSKSLSILPPYFHPHSQGLLWRCGVNYGFHFLTILFEPSSAPTWRGDAAGLWCALQSQARGCCREWHRHRHQIGASEQSLGTGIQASKHSAPTLPASGASANAGRPLRVTWHLPDSSNSCRQLLSPSFLLPLNWQGFEFRVKWRPKVTPRKERFYLFLQTFCSYS